MTDHSVEHSYNSVDTNKIGKTDNIRVRRVTSRRTYILKYINKTYKIIFLFFVNFKNISVYENAYLFVIIVFKKKKIKTIYL